MKKAAVHLIALILPLLAVIAPVQADILLSELCDPRYNYLSDRFIEIYNSGTESVSLTGWQVIAVGNTVDIFTWNLSGDIAPGQALVCGDQTTVIPFQIDFPEEAWSESNATWNGKVGDGAKLRNNSGIVLDSAVVPGTTFENADLVRNENIVQPNTSFDASEWTATPVNEPTEGTPGTHHAPPPPIPPTITGVTTDPASPQAGDTVMVSAQVTDDLANITSVELSWGLASGSLTNTIAMNPTAGDTYTTATAIPGQIAGSIVFYQVSATNDVPATATTDELSYGLPWTLTIGDIQGTGIVSPHVGHSILTGGIVTANYNSTWVIQDGTGTRSGVWVEGGVAPALGSNVTITGVVQELNGNTTITEASVNSSSAGSLPTAAIVTTGTAGSEDFEGVLVKLFEATCTINDADNQQWYLDNDGTALRVDNTGVTYAPTLGSVYTVTGPVSDNSSFLGIVPRTSGDVVFVTDPTAPIILSTEAQGPTSVMIIFSEDVDQTSAENAANYTVSGSTVDSALRIVGQPDIVVLTVSIMSTGDHTLTINGVTDLFGNSMDNVSDIFYFYGGNVPDGYYDGTEGLTGDTLRLALHNIIDNHTSLSYTFLWTAFYTTDDRPDGTVWDMYSDVPDGVSPYIYEFGIDQTGSGGVEGTGYNREHSWPQGWYGGASPMYTDLFVLYPTDVYVNNVRGSYAYGEVDSPTWTSLNGCKLGPNVYPGYTGIAFEPIDAYKGDFARAYFYMSTRYYTEDGSWDDASPMADRSQLLPWAEAMLLEWHISDPVSQKEIDRNDTVYGFQNNRNPFIDRPDFVFQVFIPELSDSPEANVVSTILLHQNAPNPFNPSTTISYELNQDGPVRLQIFDIAGRLVKDLVQEDQVQGRHELRWNGRNNDSRLSAAGVYFYRLTAEGQDQTRRMMLLK